MLRPRCRQVACAPSATCICVRRFSMANLKPNFDMEVVNFMRFIMSILLTLLVAPVSFTQQDRSAHGKFVSPGRLVHTYSIVARDPNTGELGVAVQSHWFSVGSVVPWAEAGVGAVATQSFVDPSYGKLGLELMRAGKSAPEALKSLLAGDEGREVRQVAMIDAQGRVDA